ncbi:MAG: tetratricopeptide repeat protein [Candidatus Saccharimonas sp.]
MLGLLLVIVIGAWTIWRPFTIEEAVADLPKLLSGRLDKLWDIAQESLRDRKYLRAEKALLTILRVDEKNATAYNRLGILYAKQQAYKDAIECFEIAQSLEPNASSLHNVGLIHYETEHYEKAALAFEQAIRMEDDVASRHIAYAKVQEKLGNAKKAIEALRDAIRIEPSIQAYNVLADVYRHNGETEKADKIQETITRVMKSKHAPAKTIHQVRKVML